MFGTFFRVHFVCASLWPKNWWKKCILGPQKNCPRSRKKSLRTLTGAYVQAPMVTQHVGVLVKQETRELRGLEKEGDSKSLGTPYFSRPFSFRIHLVFESLSFRVQFSSLLTFDALSSMSGLLNFRVPFISSPLSFQVPFVSVPFVHASSNRDSLLNIFFTKAFGSALFCKVKKKKKNYFAMHVASFDYIWQLTGPRIGGQLKRLSPLHSSKCCARDVCFSHPRAIPMLMCVMTSISRKKTCFFF